MHVIRGIVAGLIAGVIGAAAWAWIASVTGSQLGWVAWGVGVLVGIGVRKGWPSGGVPAGLVAAALATGTILAGKYASVELIVHREVTDPESALRREIMQDLESDAVMTRYVADAIVHERTQSGDTIDWPAGVTAETAVSREDFPPETWSAAAAAWADMSSREQWELREQVAELVHGSYRDRRSELARNVFRHAFGWQDILIFALALLTAYKIAESFTTPASSPTSPDRPAA